MLQGSDTYQTSEKFQHAVKVYQKKKDSCVSWPLDQVTHVFYHTLIKDTSKAFDGDYKTGDYDQVMTRLMNLIRSRRVCMIRDMSWSAFMIWRQQMRMET